MVAQKTPAGSPVADSQPEEPRPDSNGGTAPVHADEDAVPVSLLQVLHAPISLNHAVFDGSVVTHQVASGTGAVLQTSPKENVLEPEAVSELAVLPLLPVNLRIRTSLPENPQRTDTNNEDLSNPDIAFHQVIVPECLPGNSNIPLSPGPSSQGHSAGSKQWADYSSDSDGGAASPIHSPGGGRLVLSPHFHASAERQRDRSPEFGHRKGPRFNIKNAARHLKRAGRGAGRRGKQ
ncbi:unnamed protein product [Calypogeia fissa]